MMKQLIVAMKGHPATGKSTLAESLSKSLKWPLIDKDDARDCLSVLLESNYPRDRESLQQRSLRKQLNAVSYDIMFRIAETQLRIGLGVIVVCPLAWPWLFKLCRSIALRNKVQMVIVECVCGDEDLWKKRLEWRADRALEMPEHEDGDASPSGSGTGGEDFKREEWADGARSVFDVHADVWWHKAQKWEELKKSVEGYGDWCNYDIGSVKRIVVDTATGSDSSHSAAVLDWIESVSD